MLEIIPSTVNINFVSKFKFTVILSLVMLLASLFLIFGKGLNYGVDFRGGAEIQVKFNTIVEAGRLRDVFDSIGHGSAVVQSIGSSTTQSEFLVRVQANEKNLNEVTTAISHALEESFTSEGADIRRTDIVGPKAGAELRSSGVKAMFYAVLAIMIYIGLRFDFKYSPGAILALMHDVIIVLGVFALFDIEFTLQIVAALLAVIGYSVNDTVVIYDRVRDHEAIAPSTPLVHHINQSANETLSRTLFTAGTTLIVSLAMYFFGGESIEEFFLAISLGIVIGTYSSMF